MTCGPKRPCEWCSQVADLGLWMNASICFDCLVKWQRGDPWVVAREEEVAAGKAGGR
jgi:hypothetical protein